MVQSSVQGLASQTGVVAYSVAKQDLSDLSTPIAGPPPRMGFASTASPPDRRIPRCCATWWRWPMIRPAAWQTINDMHPLGRSARPEEVAQLVSSSHPEGSFITGEIIRIDGVMLARHSASSPKKE